jgi:fido (protein-threonine AMPylation protein)
MRWRLDNGSVAAALDELNRLATRLHRLRFQALLATSCPSSSRHNWWKASNGRAGQVTSKNCRRADPAERPSLDSAGLPAHKTIPEPRVTIQEKIICDIHRYLCISGEVPVGEYRRADVWLLSPSRGLVFSTPPWEEVAKLMGEFVTRLNSEFDSRPAAVAAALAHLELVAIHPFEDGNGRTARRLACLLLEQSVWAELGIHFEESFLKPSKEEYHEAVETTLGSCQLEEYNGTPFVLYSISCLRSLVQREIAALSKARSGRESFFPGRKTKKEISHGKGAVDTRRGSSLR